MFEGAHRAEIIKTPDQIKEIAENVLQGMVRAHTKNGQCNLENCIDLTVKTLETQGDISAEQDTGELRDHLRTFHKQNFFHGPLAA